MVHATSHKDNYQHQVDYLERLDFCCHSAMGDFYHCRRGPKKAARTNKVQACFSFTVLLGRHSMERLNDGQVFCKELQDHHIWPDKLGLRRFLGLDSGSEDPRLQKGVSGFVWPMDLFLHQCMGRCHLLLEIMDGHEDQIYLNSVLKGHRGAMVLSQTVLLLG